MSRARPLFPASSGLPGAMKLAFETLWKAYPPRRPNPRAKAEARFAAERHACLTLAAIACWLRWNLAA